MTQENLRNGAKRENEEVAPAERVQEDQRPPEPCPEADMLAAYYERALSPGEARQMDEHFEGCARCRGELQAMARAIGPTPPRKLARGRNYWLWLVPGITVAVAAYVWFTVGPAPSGFNTRPLDRAVNSSASSRTGHALPGGTPGTVAGGGAAGEKTVVQVPEPPDDLRIIHPPIVTPAAAPVAPGVAARKKPKKSAATQSGTTGAGNAAGASATGQLPEDLPAWRFGPAGSIERSDDGGLTWHLQLTGITSDLMAGVAISDRVCWIVGRGGTVLRTTDGQHWLLVEAPVGRDLVGVTAIDQHNARVTADDRSAYETSDGGQTWHQAK
jgi:hypothetical protein